MTSIFRKIAKYKQYQWACVAATMVGAYVNVIPYADAQTQPTPTLATSSSPAAELNAENGAVEASNTEFAALAETEANRLIERHIPRELFQVIVKAKTKRRTGSDSSYLPDTLSNALPSLLGSWRQQSENIKIEIRLAAKYGEKTRNTLRDLLADKFDIDKKSITFSKLLLETQPTRSDLELQLQRAEAESRTAKSMIDTITREREDAKRDLSLAKSELDKNARQDVQKSAAKEGGISKDSLSNALLSAPFAKYLPVIVSALGLLLIGSMLFIGWSFNTTAKALGSAVRAIGESIPVLGDKMIEAANVSTASGGNERLQLAADHVTSASNGISSSTLAGVPLDSLHARLVTIHEELKSAINTNTEYAVVRYLNQLLRDESRVGKAVVSLEILGKDLANELYARLSQEDQEKIWRFLVNGQHSRSKWELMLEAGEELKTKLMAESMVGLRGRVDDKIAERVLKLRVEDLCAVANKVDVKSIPRLFLYLEPNQLADVLMFARSRDTEEFKRLSSSVLNIAAAIKETRLDAEIARVMDSHFATLKDDIQRPFFGYYKSVVDLLDETAAEELAVVLSTGGPTIQAFVQETVITFATFFRLQKEHQENIIESLGNRDLANLISGMAEDQGAKILMIISQKRMELIQEEIERNKDKGKRVLQQNHLGAKRKVVQKIMELKGDGQIRDLFSQESVAASSDTTSVDEMNSAA